MSTQQVAPTSIKKEIILEINSMILLPAYSRLHKST
jgi:hypothetical protein